MAEQTQFIYFDLIENVVDHLHALGYKDLWYNEIQLGQGTVYLRRVFLPDGSQVATCRIATKNSGKDKPKWHLFVVKPRNPRPLPAGTIPIDEYFMDIVLYAADYEHWIWIYQADIERVEITETTSATTSQLPEGNVPKRL